MKVLLLCNKSPYPPKEGGPIAMNAIIEGLIHDGHDVKVLAIDSWKFPVDIKKIPEEYLRKTKFEKVFVDLKIKPFPALRNLFTGKSYHVERFISQDYKDKLIDILREDEYDIVQLETLYITPYIETIREYSDARIVLRAHNIEHKIWERISANCRNPFKKLYLQHLTKTLREYEFSVIYKYDGIATISTIDEEFLKTFVIKTPLITIGFGIEPGNIHESSCPGDFPGLFHLGSMNWIPNQDGIKWFLEDVWNEVVKIYPELTLHLAGRHMPEWLIKNNYPNVKIVGEVDDAQDFINSKSIMIVPLFSGSGIRIKIIEAMALGKTVISTKIGADGINYCENEDIIIASTAREFIIAITKCINDKAYCRNVGERAKELIKNQHNNQLIIQKLVSFYKEIIASARKE